MFSHRCGSAGHLKNLSLCVKWSMMSGNQKCDLQEHRKKSYHEHEHANVADSFCFLAYHTDNTHNVCVAVRVKSPKLILSILIQANNSTCFLTHKSKVRCVVSCCLFCFTYKWKKMHLNQCTGYAKHKPDYVSYCSTHLQAALTLQGRTQSNNNTGNHQCYPSASQQTYQFQNATSPCLLVIAFARFSENWTSDLELKVAEIQTHPRFLIDTFVVSISNTYMASFLSYHIHKIGCPLSPTTGLMG